ncbi:MAG: NERD domain-containing protein [Nitrosomonas sp.]|nr:NERD domain-containing protein [Nitrosomonas sp.]
MSSLSLSNLVLALTVVTCICAAICIYIFSQDIHERIDIANAIDSDAALLRCLQDKNAAILHDTKGQQGEDKVHQKVLEIFKSLEIECVTNREFGRSHAILLPTGSDKYSKEIDLLVVSEIGIFVIEVKNWRGEWGAQDSSGQSLVLLTGKSEAKSVQTRSAPLRKTQNKLNILCNRAQLLDDSVGPCIPVHAIVVFTDPTGNAHPLLPTDYLHLSDLGYYFRIKLEKLGHSATGSYVRYGVQAHVDYIKPFLDGAVDALHQHMLRLSPTTISLQDYQNNYQQMLALQNRPARHMTNRQDALLSWAKRTAFFGVMTYLIHALRSWV